MTQEHFSGLVLLTVGLLAAAWAARCIAAALQATSGCAFPATQSRDEGRDQCVSIEPPPAPYEGVARRKPASGAASCPDPFAVLRPKP